MKSPARSETAHRRVLTTAELRVMAREAVHACQWQRAADYYRAAIERYPERFRDSAIGQRDIKNMRARAEGCQRHAEIEGRNG